MQFVVVKGWFDPEYSLGGKLVLEESGIEPLSAGVSKDAHFS